MDHLIENKVKQAADLAPCDVKIILLGDSAVGKSKLVERFLINDYEERQLSTYALTMFRHNTVLDGQELKVDIWDTAGQDCFNNLHPSYYFGAHACILVFDVTRKITYVNLKNWYKEMRTYCPDIPCVLIANKIDVNLDVTNKSFKFGEQYGLDFHFVSAADGTNVVMIFRETLKKALEFKNNPPRSFERDVMELLDDDSWLNS
ncbi:hypothetical protein SteCoe_15678 [Stentor coeruleus]|uniref:Uncharacterized protein n=1 Tax=Stentor coeruleus TaxID=5963 RepID=A0A1R2C371_9CILI|nr:hypothetical protein SteCoe_15678 [Stentor coeruleus]